MIFSFFKVFLKAMDLNSESWREAKRLQFFKVVPKAMVVNSDS